MNDNACKLIGITIFLTVTIITACQLPEVPAKNTYQYPQGVASADPQSTAVLLWTRVISDEIGFTPIDLKVEISQLSSFEQVVQTGKTTALAQNDFTVRYYADSLEPGQKYYYRFICGKDTSRIGRTFTAPKENESANLNFATLACSSYEQGFYGTLKRMIEEDKAKAEEEQIQLVLHLGDFIYEVVGDDPRNDNHSPKWLLDADGNPRDIKPYPDGKQWPDSDHWKSGSWSPITVEDYRHLYKTYISNAVMQEARARWPFVYTWDDHEFADGNYQSTSYIKDLLKLEGMQQVKVASNQAWFEYLPATLSQAQTIGSIDNPAYDFKPVEVENTALGEKIKEGLYEEPNNLKAIHSLCMYRMIKWGKDIVIVITDTKSYQKPGESVLGNKQKKWFKDVLKNSDAKWKLWANSEPFLTAYVDYDNVEGVEKERALIYNDSWKEANKEREELLSFIEQNNISGVVSLSGDYHIQMASLVYTEKEYPVMADFAVTAMSSFPDFFWLERKGKNMNDSLLYQLFAYPDSNNYLHPNINTAVLFGSKSATEMAASNDFSRALLKADTTINKGLKYFDCEYNGYLSGRLNTTMLEIEFVNTKNAIVDYEQYGAGIVSNVHFTLPYWNENETPKLSDPEIKGPVFPFSDKPLQE